MAILACRSKLYRAQRIEDHNKISSNLESNVKKLLDEGLEGMYKSNLGMDACTGLYDEYFKGGN